MTTTPEDLYTALISDGRATQLRRLTYRCATPHRCLLLDVIETPLGTVLHQKRYKSSPEVNLRRSSAAGRAANTIDGDRRWKPRTFYLEQSGLAWSQEPRAGQSLRCDHVGVLPDGGDVVLVAAEFTADWSCGHTEVLVRRDGSRYAVA